MALGLLMGLVFILRFAPTREEFEEYRKKEDGREMTRSAVTILVGIALSLGLCGRAYASGQQWIGDVDCVVVGLRMVQMTEPQQRTTGLLLATYYLGRLDERLPDADSERLIESEAGKMTVAEFRANATRCGEALTLKGRELQKLAADLTR